MIYTISTIFIVLIFANAIRVLIRDVMKLENNRKEHERQINRLIERCNEMSADIRMQGAASAVQKDELLNRVDTVEGCVGNLRNDFDDLEERLIAGS